MDYKYLVDEVIAKQHRSLAHIEPSRKKLSMSRFVYDLFLSQLQSISKNDGLQAVTIYKGMDVVVLEENHPVDFYISISLK